MVRAKIGPLICDILTKNVGTEENNNDLVNAYLAEVCMTIRGLSIHDDMRRDMSSAYDNGKFFLSHDGTVQHLLILSKDFLVRPKVASAALAALKQLVLSEEAVQVVSLHGAMQLPSAILGWSEAPVILVRSVTGLMRNLCADDKRKNKLVADGTLHLLIRTLSDERYMMDSQCVENAAACLAAISLRSPTNSQIIMDSGAISPLIAGMRRHADKPAVQRQACLTVRNIAARGGEEIKIALLDLGIEGVLRAAGALQGSVDEAYAALRDLNCEVQFVTVTADGYAMPVYEQFGTGKKLQFNPVYDDTSDMQHRIENEAVAPFAGGKLSSTDSVPTTVFTGSCSSDHDHSHGHDHDHVGSKDCC